MTATATVEAPAPYAPETSTTYVVLASGLATFTRGDVFTAETFRQAQRLSAEQAASELNRLLVGQAIRLAKREEAVQSRVALAGQVDRHVSYETLLASKEAELTRARARISELEGLLAMSRQQGQVPSLPENVEGVAGLLKAKDEQVAALQKQLTQALANIAAQRQPSLPPATLTPAPPPAASAPQSPPMLDPTLPPPPARSAESKAAEARVSRRGS